MQRAVSTRGQSLLKFHRNKCLKMCELRQLSAPLAKKAAVDLNETPDNITHKLEALREWVKAQTHIRSRTNDQFLIVFLRGAKFNLERAKQRLENFYVYRAKMPELFSNRDPCDSKVYTILKLGCILYLPEPIAPDGPVVALIRPNRFDLTKHTMNDVFMVGAMATDYLLVQDDNAIIAGYIVIMDLGNVSTDVVYHFNPSFARKLVILVNKVSPGRLKSFHFLNVPSMFTKLFNLVKSVINEKLRDRIYLHDGNLETLYKYVPRKILPKDYGGEWDDSEWANETWQKFQTNADYLKEEDSYGVIGKLKNTGDSKNDMFDAEFGIEGSFRKLSFD